MLLRVLATVLSAGLTVIACTNCTNESPEPYTIQPPPWTLKGTVYGAFLLPGLGVPLDNVLPKKAFAPLERQFPYAVAGNYTGKIGMIQVVRYSESPVGPYDEMFIIPGFFEYLRDGEIKEGVRVSRIYVSQKYCVWNSRKAWNQPKHLAKFDFTSNLDGSETVKVFPFDTSGDPSESGPSEKPWFQMTFSPLIPDNLGLGLLPLKGLDALNPRIPFTSDFYKLLGVNATLIQPPVPEGHDIYGALVSGGPTWKAVVPGQYSDQTSLGTIDLDQSGGDGEDAGVNAVGDEFEPNFWPGMPRRTVGLKMEDTTLDFSEPEVWA